MFVFVTADAGGGKAQPCAIEVFVLQYTARGGGNMLCVMAGSASDTDMPAVENISGFRMIESGRSWLPVDHREVFAVVIGVAAGTGRALRSGLGISRVQSSMCFDLRGNFAVTIEAAKLRRAGRNLVAFGAVGGAAQGLVRTRQRAGRNLRLRLERQVQQEELNPDAGGQAGTVRCAPGEPANDRAPAGRAKVDGLAFSPGPHACSRVSVPISPGEQKERLARGNISRTYEGTRQDQRACAKSNASVAFPILGRLAVGVLTALSLLTIKPGCGWAQGGK